MTWSRALVLGLLLALVMPIKLPDANAMTSNGNEHVFWAAPIPTRSAGQAPEASAVTVVNAAHSDAAVSFQTSQGWTNVLLATESTSAQDTNVPSPGSSVSPNGLRIEAPQDVAAYLFTRGYPVPEGSAQESTLLLDELQLGTDYYAVGRPDLPYSTPGPKQREPTFLTVVATRDNTVVQIETTADIASGPGVSALPAGTLATFHLEAFDVLHLETSVPTEGSTVAPDITGTRVESTAPVAVFSGSICSAIGSKRAVNWNPNKEGTCDSLVEQLTPNETGGLEFAGCLFSSWGVGTFGDGTLVNPGNDASQLGYARLIALRPGPTHVYVHTADNSTANNVTVLLNGPGQWTEVDFGDSWIEADQPIEAYGLSGYGMSGWAMERLLPTSQWGYGAELFQAPQTGFREAITVTRNQGSNSTPFTCARIQLGPGLTRFASNQPMQAHTSALSDQQTTVYYAGFLVNAPPGACSERPLGCQAAAQIPPVAAFTFTTQSSCSQLMVHLDGSTSGDIDGYVLTYVWTVDAGAPLIGPTQDIQLAAGPHQVSLTVFDNDGLASAPSTQVITGILDQCPPHLLAAPLQTIQAGQAWMYCPEASGGNGVPFTFSVGTLPVGLSWNGHCLNGTIAPGSYCLQISVTDGQASDWGCIYLRVEQPNTPLKPVQDSDQDGVADAQDNCPTIPNHDQADFDGDGAGDVCSTMPPPKSRNEKSDQLGSSAKDTDQDGIPDVMDNCPNVANNNQTDFDHDGFGDSCDLDLDGDGVGNASDNCPQIFNGNQADHDYDGVGDVCQPRPHSTPSKSIDCRNCKTATKTASMNQSTPGLFAGIGAFCAVGSAAFVIRKRP